MSEVKVQVVPLRRVIHSACCDIITDSKMAERLYMLIMDRVEEYLYECEDQEVYEAKTCPMCPDCPDNCPLEVEHE